MDGDINITDRYGNIPLLCCPKDIAEILIAKCADINIKDKNGRTPLHNAAFRGRKDIVELLIAKGADIAGSQGKKI